MEEREPSRQERWDDDGEVDDFIRGLSDDVSQDLSWNYIRLECHIALEIRLAGLSLNGSKFYDAPYLFWLGFSFSSAEDRETFISMVEFDDHPSGLRWDLEYDADEDAEISGFIVCIPRMDLYVVHRNLKRMNELMVENYGDLKKAALDVRQHWRGGWPDV